jgi:hypothetical protein
MQKALAVKPVLQLVRVCRGCSSRTIADASDWLCLSVGVNRRRTLTPNRRPRLTPILGGVQRVALAPAELVRVAQPGRARMV